MRQFLLLLLAIVATAGSLHAGVRVPEIDPSSLVGPMALVVGGGLITIARFRRK